MIAIIGVGENVILQGIKRNKKKEILMESETDEGVRRVKGRARSNELVRNKQRKCN